MTPNVQTLYAVTEATWPPADRTPAGPWMLRNGAGGGKRVSAATAEGDWREEDLSAAETAMRMLGQDALFMIREGDGALDAALADRGYEVIDPVNLWVCPIDQLTDLRVPRVTAFSIWEPLEIMRDIWASGGIGPERIAVMERAKGPKTGFLLRHNDKPSGVAFVAMHADTAMVHALEILPEHRRQGLGHWTMRAAAFWARDHGAQNLSVICTKANEGANGLYRALGMEIAGEYHYRHLV